MDGPGLQWAGTIGFWLIEGSYLPQIGRLYRLKRAEEFSFLFPAANLLGRVLALLYVLSRHDGVLVFGFALGIALRAVLLGQIAWYSRSEARSGATTATNWQSHRRQQEAPAAYKDIAEIDARHEAA